MKSYFYSDILSCKFCGIRDAFFVKNYHNRMKKYYKKRVCRQCHRQARMDNYYAAKSC